MRSRPALMLSLCGVVGAGLAAAWVNHRVLSDDTTATTLPLVTVTRPSIDEQSTTSTSSTSTSSTEPATPSTNPPSSTSLAVTVATTATSTEQTYRLGDAASVILDDAGGALTIVDLAPHPGWEVSAVDGDGSPTVSIALRSADGAAVRFDATLIRGIVAVSLAESSAPSGAADDDDRPAGSPDDDDGVASGDDDDGDADDDSGDADDDSGDADDDSGDADD